MEVEEDVLDHDVNLVILEQELVVDPGEDAAEGFADYEEHAQAEGHQRGEGVRGEGVGFQSSWW